MERAEVTPSLSLTQPPPSSPGVYAFLGVADRIMYVGMAHDLEKVLYRYQHLEGRQKMRDRAAKGLIEGIVWLALPERTAPATLEAMLIGRYEPPWNTQHNPTPRAPVDAVPLTEPEVVWIEETAAILCELVEGLDRASEHPRSAEEDVTRSRRKRRSTCRDLVLASMIDLERKSGRAQFKLVDIVKNAQRMSDDYPETTLRTQISSIMCADAPIHHMNHTDDLRRVSRGVYERINRDAAGS